MGRFLATNSTLTQLSLERGYYLLFDGEERNGFHLTATLTGSAIVAAGCNEISRALASNTRLTGINLADRSCDMGGMRNVTPFCLRRQLDRA